MADNFVANPGSGGDTFAADDVSGVKVPYSKIDIGGDGVSSPVTSSNPMPVSGNVGVAGSVAVTGTFWQATQPVSGPLTDTQLRATAVPVSGTVNTVDNGTNYTFSTANSSSVQLASGATFTGTIESVTTQQSISILMSSDQPIQLTFYQYSDASGVYAGPPRSFYIPASQGISWSMPLNCNYCKLTATNVGRATSTTFRLDIAYGTIPSADLGGNAPTTLYGSGDLYGVSLLESVINGETNLTTQVVNTEKRDINGARVVSDAPKDVQLVASTVGQQFLIDTQGYQTIALTMGTMAATLTGSNTLTASTFSAISAIPVVLGAPVSTAAASTNYVVPCLTRYIKLTVTTLGWCQYSLRSIPHTAPYLANSPVNLAQYLGATAASTNPIHVTPLALAATNNQTIPAINVVTATAPAATVLKASAGRLTMLTIANGTAQAAYLHLYNAAAVTLGTTASSHVYAIPAAVANYPIQLPDGGLFFSAGIAYAFTAGIASLDNTAFGVAPALVANTAFI